MRYAVHFCEELELQVSWYWGILCCFFRLRNGQANKENPIATKSLVEMKINWKNI